MKITSRDARDARNILTWADIDVKDDNQHDMRTVKKITFTCEAGDIATLEVETYNMDSNGVINENGVLSPSTSIKTYCVDKIAIEAKGFEELQRDKVQAKTKQEEDLIEKMKNERLTHINPINELEL